MLNVFEYISYRQLLKDLYEAHKKKLSSFSYRYIGQKVGFKSAGFFSNILQGKRNISQNTIFRFAELFKFNKKLHRFLLYSNFKDFEKYANIGSYIYIDDVNSYNKKLYVEFEKYFKEHNIRFPDWLTSILNADFENYLPEDILTKVDRSAMAHALETRPPLLSNDLIEFAAILDSSYKLRGNEGKYILKKAMRGLLPDEIIDRPKKGFGSPIKHYFRNELKDFVKKWTVDYNKHNQLEMYDINKIYNDHIIGIEDYSRLLFSIMMFNMW